MQADKHANGEFTKKCILFLSHGNPKNKKLNFGLISVSNFRTLLCWKSHVCSNIIERIA